MTAPSRHSATVVAAEQLTPLMRRVVLRVPTLTALPLRPAQDVGLVFAGPDGRELRRRYTIRRPDPTARTIALDGVLHGPGPGAAWFTAAQERTEVDLVGPRGKIVLNETADWHLFVGDESGVPAFAELAALLDNAVVVAEVDRPAEEQPLPGARWVHRYGAPPGEAGLLAAALRAVTPPPGRGAAYLLGESRAMVALRPAVEALGVAHADTFLKGYWNLGRASR